MKRIGFIDGRRVAGWNFPATLTPGNGQVMTILDPSIVAGGAVRGRHLSYTATGDKTGASQTIAESVSLSQQGDSRYAYGRSTHIAVSGDPSINYLSGHFIYMDDIGAEATVQKMCALDLGINVTNAPTEESTFIRAYSHGGLVRSFAWLPSSEGITYLFDFETAVAPVGANVGDGALTVTGMRAIAIRVAEGVRYIPTGTALTVA